jgi:N-terminal acetyltransferase B complex non-catalytic subunit
MNLNIPRMSFQTFIENKNYLSTFDKLGEICKKLYDIEPNHEYINKIYSNYLSVKNYIQKDYKYRISLLGGISTGKSSIINSLIGYDLDLIPKSSGDCTNIALIIHYTENKDNISLYETKFDNHNKYSNFYFFSKEKIISKGKENVKEFLKALNEKKIDEIPYYILETPIEFLDENIQDNSRKLEIEFVDLPGINNQKFDSSFLSNLINFTDFFLFINDKDVIQDENKDILEDFFKNILSEKTYINLNTIMFVINQIDLIPEIKNNKKNINNIIKDFSKEINFLFKQITSNEWNNYLKFCEICKGENMLFSYFSNEYYNKNKKRKKEMNELFNNCVELIKYMIQKYKLENHKTEEKIQGILKYLKKDYFNKLENKNEYNDKANLNIELDLKNICDELKISDGDKKMNYPKLEEIIKKYNFIKMNLDKIEFNYNFHDFFINIKNKITERDVNAINSVIFKFISELYIDFKRINENLLRIETNKEIKIIKSDKLKKTYEDYKKKLEDEFQEKINDLKTIEEQIINTQDNRKYYLQFLNKFNEIPYFLSETIRKYSIEIFICHKKIIKKYSLKSIEREEYAYFPIDLREFMKDKRNIKLLKIYGGGHIITSLLGITLNILFNYNLTTILLGTLVTGLDCIILFPLCLVATFFILKYFRKKQINKNLKNYFDILDKIKGKFLKKIEEIYNNALNDIRNYEISQKEFMLNIYNRKEEFKNIQKEYQNIFAYK